MRKQPMNHTRKILTGIVGLSTFDTAARTSAKGLSSSAYSNCESTSRLHCQSHRRMKNKFQTHLILFSFLSYPERSPLELAGGTSSDMIAERVVNGVSSAGTTKLNTPESVSRRRANWQEDGETCRRFKSEAGNRKVAVGGSSSIDGRVGAGGDRGLLLEPR